MCGFWVKALPLWRTVSRVRLLTCQMQDRVRPFRVLLQGLDSFGRRQHLELNFAAMSLAVHLFHHRQRSGSGADHKPLTLPGISSSIESGVCPNLSRNLLDGFSYAYGCDLGRSRRHSRKWFRQCRLSQMKMLRNACATFNSRSLCDCGCVALRDSQKHRSSTCGSKWSCFVDAILRGCCDA